MHCVDLDESFPTSIYLQNLASIQPRTSPKKFGKTGKRDFEISFALTPVRAFEIGGQGWGGVHLMGRGEGGVPLMGRGNPGHSRATERKQSQGQLKCILNLTCVRTLENKAK